MTNYVDHRVIVERTKMLLGETIYGGRGYLDREVVPVDYQEGDYAQGGGTIYGNGNPWHHMVSVLGTLSDMLFLCCFRPMLFLRLLTGIGPRHGLGCLAS